MLFVSLAFTWLKCSTCIVDAYLVFFHYMQQMHIGQCTDPLQRSLETRYLHLHNMGEVFLVPYMVVLATREDSVFHLGSPIQVYSSYSDPFLMLCTCGSISLHVEKLKRLRRGQKSRDLAPHLCILDCTTCKGKNLLSSKSLLCLEN